MSSQPVDGVEVLRALWAAEGQDSTDLDDVCGPQKSCKNMEYVSFDGMAEPGSDLGDAWRERLRREGKLDASGKSIRDLVLGSQTSR